ncbi:uncharacterized protein LOC122536225 [Frieseomelitta varia]|uniref:uncharacterized protein LOC122536225 n=1 Tax=Frieseomelitta varia TaxID=561572 RepID=UPI001CB689C7|nr:uncharacterized protein LOC122536225 [Frieseomelitta varia]
MKFVCSIYILIVVFVENKENFLVRCIANVEEHELVHLSQKLNALECLQLVQAVYEVTPTRMERKVKNRETPREDLSRMPITSEECLLNLEQWKHDFPTNMKPTGRAAMEMTLRWLGRPDLAKYVRENPRLIKLFDTEGHDVAGTLEFPGHRVSRRQAQEMDKNPNTRVMTKKRRTKKKKMKHRGNSKAQNKGVKRAMIVAAAHPASHKSHRLKKKGNLQPRKIGSAVRTSIWCSILFVLFFVTICLVGVYFYYKRNHSKARGTRFKHIRNVNKKDKNTFTDNLEWNDDDVCSCSDIEDCTEKCEMCDQIYQTRYVVDHRIGTDDSIKSLTSVREPKKEEKRSCQNKKKEKDQNNRDRKKILDKIVAKRCEKMPRIVRKDQCKCCRCILNSRDKIRREKKELHKWKAKRKKEEKKRRKEELRRTEELANVCFNETCK